MLQNAYLLAKIGADTAENEQHFAEKCCSFPERASAAVRSGMYRGLPDLLQQTCTESHDVPPEFAIKMTCSNIEMWL